MSIPFLLILGIVIFPQKNIACGKDLNTAMNQDYSPEELEKVEPGAKAMYDKLLPFLERDNIEENTNWIRKRNPRNGGPDQHYFICFNYMILPSQEECMLKQLDAIPSDKPIDLTKVLASLNGYHNHTNRITDSSKIQNDDFFIDSKSRKEIGQVENKITIDNELINQNYNTMITMKPEDFSRSVNETSTVSVKHGATVGANMKMTINFGAVTAGFGKSVEIGLSAEYSYENSRVTSKTETITRRAWPMDIPIQPRTGVVISYEFSHPRISEEYDGTMGLSGTFTDTVNNSTWVTLGIYPKFKTIQMSNPRIWRKLQSMGFSIDDYSQKVIFKGKIQLDKSNEINYKYKIITQTYNLNAAGDIDYSKPIGAKKIEEKKERRDR